jgi:hypothetical protein
MVRIVTAGLQEVKGGHLKLTEIHWACALWVTASNKVLVVICWTNEILPCKLGRKGIEAARGWRTEEVMNGGRLLPQWYAVIWK